VDLPLPFFPPRRRLRVYMGKPRALFPDVPSPAIGAGSLKKVPSSRDLNDCLFPRAVGAIVPPHSPCQVVLPPF